MERSLCIVYREMTNKFIVIFSPFVFKVWFGEHMFVDSFCFFTGYNIPKCKTIQEYMEVIEQMPLTDTPEVFGLHPNADIT